MAALKIWIALLRGVNVGGNRKLPMKELVTLMEGAGFRSVRTYIQSGNVVFASPRGTARALATQIGQLIARKFGFEPQVLVIGAAELATAVRGNPFPQGQENHKALHVFFLSETPVKPDIDLLEKVKAGKEGFALQGGVFYLYTPESFPDSKLAARVEKALGVPATARNWRTVRQLLDMCGEQS
jgi:uncharacterized protein (DUF1697 family)